MSSAEEGEADVDDNDSDNNDSDDNTSQSDTSEEDEELPPNWNRGAINQNAAEHVFDIPEPMEIKEPYEYFKLFVNDDMLHNISEQTNI